VSDIDFLAAFAYSTGQDPIDYAAVNVIAGHIDAHVHPDAYPADTDPVTAALSRRIVGDLLDAGWTPPEVTP
jgi:hypothetical protein